MTRKRTDGEGETSPRVFHQPSDAAIPWSGDGDFLAWQRRKRSVTSWDLVAALLLVLVIPAGWLLFRATGSSAAALAGLVGTLALAVVVLVRRSWWSLTGR